MNQSLDQADLETIGIISLVIGVVLMGVGVGLLAAVRQIWSSPQVHRV